MIARPRSMIRYRNDLYLTGKHHSVRSPYGEVGTVARDHGQLRAEALVLTSDKNLNLHTKHTLLTRAFREPPAFGWYLDFSLASGPDTDDFSDPYPFSDPLKL